MRDSIKLFLKLGNTADECLVTDQDGRSVLITSIELDPITRGSGVIHGRIGVYLYDANSRQSG